MANLLGFAVQLRHLRFPGVVLGPEQLPAASLLTFVATMLKLSVPELTVIASVSKRCANVSNICWNCKRRLGSKRLAYRIIGPPVGADGANRIIDEVGAVAPCSEADEPFEQLQGLDNAAETLAAEVGAAGDGGVGAGRKEGSEGHGVIGRQPLAHVGSNADDIALAGFAGRVLKVYAVAEVAGINSRLDERGGEVEATDDDGGRHGDWLEIRLVEVRGG